MGIDTDIDMAVGMNWGSFSRFEAILIRPLWLFP